MFAALPLLTGVLAAATHGEISRSFLRIFRYVVAAELLLVVALATAGAFYEARHRAAEKRGYQPPGRLIDVGGYRLHLYCTGTGSPTVVLDFGLDGSYLDWHRVQPELSRFTRVCSYDRGGYGWSDSSRRPRVPSVMAEELHDLLTAAGERPPYVVVAHSFGGFNALMFAHKYPAELAGVVLVDSTNPDQEMEFPLRKKFWLRFLQFTMRFGLPRWRKWCGQGPSEIAGMKAALECRSHVYRTNYAQFASFAASAAELRSIGSLGNVPLAVISRDPKRAPDPPSAGEQRWQAMQRDLLRFSTRSKQIIADGSNHSIPTQRPDIIVSTVMDWFCR